MNRVVDLYLPGWAWLHVLDGNEHIGLLERDGTEKMAFREWKGTYTGR